MASPEPSAALNKRSSKDVALMPSAPIKKTKRPPKILDEDEYTDALSDIIARDYFPGLRESQAQQEYLAALDSNDESWIAEAAQRLRNAASPAQRSQVRRDSRDTRFDAPLDTSRPQPARAVDTPVGHDGSETPGNPPPASTSAQEADARNPDTSKHSLSTFQSIYTSEDNASFNDVVDKQNNTRRARHAHLFTPDQRIPSKRLLLYRAKEQQLLKKHAEETVTAKKEGKELISMTNGATDSRPAKPDSWKSKAPTNNLMFNATSVDEDGLPTQLEEREQGSKAGARQVVHENTRFPPLQYIDHVPAGGVPESPSLNTDILQRREQQDYPGGETPRVNGYAFVDEDEPANIPQPAQTGPSYRDLLAGQVGDATPNPFKLSGAQKREALHHKIVEDNLQKKRKKDLETKQMGREDGNMTPAAKKLMQRIGGTPLRQPKEDEGWTPVRTPRRIKS